MKFWLSRLVLPSAFALVLAGAAISPAVAQPPPPAATEEAPADDTVVPTAPEIRSRADAIRQRAEDIRRRDRERADEDRARARERAANRTGREVVNIFGDSSLPAGERADNVVAVFGSATSAGDVAESVVAVFGDNRVSGPVGESVVAVFGNAVVDARVYQEVVVVFGNVTVNSRVRRVVSVFGDVTLGPKAEVDEEVVCVMGQVERDPAAVVRHSVNNIGRSFGLGEGLGVWLKECLFKGRPLAFTRSVGWAWIVAGAFLGLYLFLSLLFRGGIEKCVSMLETRPGSSALTALGAVVLTPFVSVLLCITVVGILVVPFFATGLFFAGLFGRAVMLAWLGRRVLGVLSARGAHPFFAVLIGGGLVLLLYTVPVLGVLTYKLFGWLGLGVVLYTLFVSLRREKPGPAFAGVPFAAIAPPFVSEPPLANAPEVGGLPPLAPLPTPVISSLTLPRAGFWIRFGALLLDLILLGVFAALMAGHGELAPFGIVAYASLMWKLKGTTIGGIICNLKVVRVDGRELDWTTAIVRSLACFLSLAAFGLGFIWVAIDDDRQSWHDKIAGTTVVRVPKGTALL